MREDHELPDWVASAVGVLTGMLLAFGAVLLGEVAAWWWVPLYGRVAWAVRDRLGTELYVLVYVAWWIVTLTVRPERTPAVWQE